MNVNFELGSRNVLKSNSPRVDTQAGLCVVEHAGKLNQVVQPECMWFGVEAL